MTDARPPTSRFVRVEGARVHVLEWGGDDEPPLVLVPGAGASGWVYAELAPLLAQERRVMAISPRGHGLSDPPAGRLTLDRCAEDVAGAMDLLEIRAAAMAAHSLGGHAATRLVAARPDLVSALVYLDAVVDYAGWMRMRARDPLQTPPPANGVEPDRAWLERYSYGFWHEALDADLRAVPEAAGAPSRARIMTDLMEDAAMYPPPYSDVHVPVLALVAAEAAPHVWPWMTSLPAAEQAKALAFLRDVRTPFKRSVVERFQRNVPQARVVYVPGHHFLHLTARDVVLREMRTFLREARP